MRKKVMYLLICLFIIFNMVNIFMISHESISFIPTIGKTFAGVISLFINPGAIQILSPENTTYNFSVGENYTLDLNVTGDESLENWWYTLNDLRHDVIVYENISFTPNTTFNAVRWMNNLTVYANYSSGFIISDYVVFFIYVPNSAPIIENISDDIYVCENESLSHFFNVTDADEDDLTLGISPMNPFYVFKVSKIWNLTTGEIVSVVLNKDHIGIHEEIVSASDSEYVDTEYVNITVIEINNPPEMENLGVYTIWTQGENSTFYKQVQVNDTEDGNQDSGNLTFNLTFSNNESLFNISEYGIMNFTPNSSQVGVYNLTVCVTDKGIDSPHENISLCGQDGGNITLCDNFSLTITDENRYPYIIDYYPYNLTFSASGDDSLYFNITKYDPDGTIPDAYWYVDDVLKEYDSESLIDEFSYTFGCGIYGEHKVKAEITDGLLNDSIEWIISVSHVLCPPGISPGGGSGAIGCREKWVCGSWQICQNTKRSFDLGIISPEDYRFINPLCLEEEFDDRYCGFQVRTCFDLNNCSNINPIIKKPLEVQLCYYTEFPNCHDGITNCHDGDCELLVDCGGPCPPCPTCSDGIQNQNEDGIDCGGPCIPCPPEIPFRKRTIWRYLLIILLIIILIIIIIRVIRIIQYKRGVNRI